MTTIELKINGKLCDTGKNFSVRLKRQLLKPAELNTKDAQCSYSISLPTTAANDEAFNYGAVEETKNKFNREYGAELYIDGLRIFKGYFRPSEISRRQYKGNLYIPVSKSIKDVFGETKLNENPEYPLDFGAFARSVTKYNTDASKTPQPAIFPYVLYGVLPKVPDASGGYSARNIWDEYVHFHISDLPASLNVLKMLSHIFTSNGYNLQGTAFDDERLTRLYMSYKNDSNYDQPWNYGRLATMRLKGSWSNVTDMSTGGAHFEKGVQKQGNVTGVNLFDSTNVHIDTKVDEGGNIKTASIVRDGKTYKSVLVTVPVSGLYKIRLNSDTQILTKGGGYDSDTGTRFVNGRDNDENDSRYVNFFHQITEFKLLRDRLEGGGFGLSSPSIDATYYRNNLPQDNEYGADDDPKYTPVAQSGAPLFIDRAQNEYYTLGMHWGRRPSVPVNPLDTTNQWAQVHAAKPALSWDGNYNDGTVDTLAISSPGYMHGVSNGQTGAANWGWTPSERFKIDLDNAPNNYARRGYKGGSSGYSPYMYGGGSVNAIVWLEKGEILTLAVTTTRAREGIIPIASGWLTQQIDFDLNIELYRSNREWVKVNSEGLGSERMDWAEQGNVPKDYIDLVKFLPADVKTDDFIDNFCKAFNLKLSQVDTSTFSLDVKQTRSTISPLAIDLDGAVSMQGSFNTPTGLPSAYKLGFTVDQEEEGYVKTGEDGGGFFETGAIEENVIDQKSTFSYSWFKDIKYTIDGANINMALPIISKSDVWVDLLPYVEAMTKRYTSSAVRFWYHDGLLNDLGARFEFNGDPLSIAKVSNSLRGVLTLTYKNEANTILSTYFTLLVNSSSHYTNVEAYLTPELYEALNGDSAVKINGDQYYVAEIDGYDPTGRNKTKIKLIRQI